MVLGKTKKTGLLVLLAFLIFNQLLAHENSVFDPPLIFPKPQEMKLSTESFLLDANTHILVPPNASKSDVELAKFLVRDLVDKYYLPLQTHHTSELPLESNRIVLGTIDNPLIKEYCLSRDIHINRKNPGQEGYVLIVDQKTIIVAGYDDAGAFYGLQTLRQLIDKRKQFNIPCLTIRDWPYFEFRGIRLFVPASGDVAYFKRFIKDFMALYKFNKLIVEFGGFRSDSHPEINAGWLQFVKDLNYTRTPELDGLFGYNRNSNHQDAGGGEIIDKEFTRNLVRFTRQNHIDFIPEIPTLSHAYAMINAHPELAVFPDDIWPDVYDPTNPVVYDLVFNVFDEYIDAVKPNMIHIGHVYHNTAFNRDTTTHSPACSTSRYDRYTLLSSKLNNFRNLFSTFRFYNTIRLKIKHHIHQLRKRSEIMTVNTSIEHIGSDPVISNYTRYHARYKFRLINHY